MADRLAAPGTLQTSPAGFTGRTASLELPAAPSSRQTCTRHGSRSLQVQCQIPNGQQNARSRPAGPRQDSVQARAMAVTWDTYWPEPEETLREQADASGVADSRPSFFAPNTPTAPARPLKINRDLLLYFTCVALCDMHGPDMLPLPTSTSVLQYHSRMARQQAWRSPSAAQRRHLSEQAEVLCRRVLEMDATDGRAYVGLGKILVAQRRHEEARKVYEEGAAATGGENEFIWQAWAVLEGKMGNTGYARKLFDAATVANSKHAAAWHGWGLLEKREGNMVKARDLWVKGIKTCASEQERLHTPYLHHSLALLAAEVGQVKEARKWFLSGTLTLQGAQSGPLWCDWAVMEQRRGDRKLCRYLFSKSLEALPRGRFTYLSWATFEQQERQLDNAQRLLERGHQLNQREPAILQAWARLEAKRGNLDRARQLFRLGADCDPTHTYIWQAWGVMEFNAGDLDRARELFQEGVWADPTSTAAAHMFQPWAVLEQKAGNIKLARELFKCAVKADPSSKVSWRSWAALEESQGAYVRASELRNYSLQEQTAVVVPSNFVVGESKSTLAPVLKQVMDWFKKVDDARSLAMQRGRPHLPPALQRSQAEERVVVKGSRVRPEAFDVEAARKFHRRPLTLPDLATQPGAAHSSGSSS